MKRYRRLLFLCEIVDVPSRVKVCVSGNSRVPVVEVENPVEEVGQVQAKGVQWTDVVDGVRDPWGEPYQYGTAGTPDQTEYLILSKGADKTAGTDDDVWASSSSAPVQSSTPDVTPTTTVNSAS